MRETQRTLIFAGVALVALVAALFAGPSTPKPPKDFDSVGKEFFPEFTNASDAKSLEVVSYDKETAEARVLPSTSKMASGEFHRDTTIRLMAKTASRKPLCPCLASNVRS